MVYAAAARPARRIPSTFIKKALTASTALTSAVPIILALGTLTAGAAAAAPLVLTGDYIKIGLNDAGTLGYGGNTRPGILYDGTGTGSFNPDYDYLTPGSPFEGFTVKGDGGSPFSYSNNNSHVAGAPITGTLTSYNGIEYNGSTYDQRAVWEGSYAGLFTIVNDYYFNLEDQQVKIQTTITATEDLTGLTFARFLDPDAVAAPGDSTVTNNFRGTEDVSENDLVYAEALASQYVIGLYSNSAVTHNTGISRAPWSTNPDFYLSGTDHGYGDYSIGLGFDIGGLTKDDSISLFYQYIFGTDIAAAIDDSGAATPPGNIGAGSSWTSDDLLDDLVNPVFEGGTLLMSGNLSLPTDMTFSTGGGIINTGGNAATLSGTLSGSGGLTKTGSGILTLTGSNSYAGGTVVQQGTLRVSGDSALGDSASGLELDGGTLGAAASMTTARSLTLGSGGGTIDTGSNAVTWGGAVSGDGGLTKTGGGTLTLTGSNSYAGGTVVQQGMLRVGSDSALGNSAAGVQINGGTLGITNNMSMARNLIIGGSGGIIDTGQFDLTYSGSASGDACITKRGSGRLILSGSSSNAVGACVDQGSLVQNGVFTGNIWVQSSGTLRGAGTINGVTEVAGRLAPGNSPGTLTFTNSVVQLPGSSLQIDIDGTGTGEGAGNYARLVITGENSSYTADGSLEPILRGITGDATNSYTPDVGTAFTIVEAEGGILGAFAELVQPVDGLALGTQFEVFYDSQTILLAVTPLSYGALAGLDMKENAAAAGGALDALALDGEGAALRMATAGLESAAVADVLHAMSGEIHADMVAAGVEGRRLGRDGVGQRLAALRLNNAENRVREGYPDLWVEFMGRTGRVDADSIGNGYRFNAGGVAIGADYAVGSNLRAGIGAATVWGEVNARGLGEGDLRSSQLFVYGSWLYQDMFVDAVLAHSWDRYDTDRGLALGGGIETFTSRDKATNWAGDISLGARRFVGSYVIEPGVGLRWDEARRRAVTESGSALARLSLDKTGHDMLESRVGARASRTFSFEKMALTPQVRAYWLHDFQGVKWQTARLQGEDFAIAASKRGRDAALVGAGVNLDLGQSVQLYLDYDLRLRSSEDAHNLTGGARLRF